MGGMERRKFERLDKQTIIKYQVVEPELGEGPLQSATMLDCSGGGVRCMTSERHQKNAQLLLVMEFCGWLDEGKDWTRTGTDSDVGELRMLGSVMWCQERDGEDAGYEVGIRFTGRIK